MYYKPCAELDRCNKLIEKYWDTGGFEQCFAGHLELAEATHYPLAEYQVGYFYSDGIGTSLERCAVLGIGIQKNANS